MPRLALSLPTELGADLRSSPDRTVRETDSASVRLGAETDGHERPKIERWLDCWQT